MKRILKLALPVCLLLVIAAASVFFSIASTRAASPQACGSWSIVPSPNPGGPGRELNAVAALAANDVWAVGASSIRRLVQQTLVEQWNGRNWRVVPSPSVGYFDVLGGVTALSASDVWAVGGYNDNNGNGQSLIEHWDGSSWSIVPHPTPGPLPKAYIIGLSGVAGLSANDVWAVGAYTAIHHVEKTLIEHWDGSSWSIVPSPSPEQNNNLFSVTVVKGTQQAWAVGRSYNTRNNTTNGIQTLIERWNGKQWFKVPSPNNGSNNALTGVKAISANDIWAVGTATAGSQTLTEHWNGSRWSVVPSPNAGAGNYLISVAASSTDNVWAVGFFSKRGRTAQTLTEHWNGTGWSIVPSPNHGTQGTYLYGVATVRTTGQVWAVGAYDGTPPLYTLTEFYC